MHLLTIVIFAYSVKIERTFFTAIVNDREITQKKQRPGLDPDIIKTAIFSRNEKTQKAKEALALRFQCI